MLTSTEQIMRDCYTMSGILRISHCGSTPYIVETAPQSYAAACWMAVLRTVIIIIICMPRDKTAVIWTKKEAVLQPTSIILLNVLIDTCDSRERVSIEQKERDG